MTHDATPGAAPAAQTAASPAPRRTGTARPAALPRVCVVNLGCRVNRVESDWMEIAFLGAGCELVAEDEADVVAVNTCAVTGEAQAKTRKAVRHALDLPRAPLVAVTGCVANLFPEELHALGERVMVVPSKLTLAHDVLGSLGVRAPEVGGAESAGTEARRFAPSRAKRGVKVQDGCDNRCTYCIVWRARGRSASMPFAQVRAQVEQVLAEGAREVDLTGINLGRYSSADEDGAPLDFAGLLRRVAALVRPRGAQVRASSVEPPEATRAVARAFAENGDALCPHLHLPLQSGCTATLRRMGRTYGAEDFLRVAEGLRAELPLVSLSTDVIVGFPGETDEEFEASLALCRRVGFSKMHVFRFSARPDTPAASMPGQVDPRVIQERSERMRALADEMRALDASARVGGVERVLVERVDARGRAWGTTESFHRAQVVGADTGAGLVRCRLDGLSADGRTRHLVCRPVAG